MKKYYIIALLALVIFASGCVQSSAVFTDSINKIKSLESGGGYLIEYSMTSKTDLNDKLSQSLSAEGSAKAVADLTAMMPSITLKVSSAKKGYKRFSSIDMSDLIGTLGSSLKPFPVKSSAIYMDLGAKNVTICLGLTSNNTLICTQADLKGKYNATKEIEDEVEASQKFLQQNPINMVKKVKELLDKGIITLSAQSTKEINVGGSTASCDSISYQIPDINRLSPKEILSAAGQIGQQYGSDQMPEDQISKFAAIFKQMIKNIRGEICIDKKSGVPLTYEESSEMDMSVFGKLSGSLGNQSKIPDGAGMTIKMSTVATKLKTPIDNSELAVPENAVISADGFGLGQ